jgi:hypothetical protein
MQYVKAFEFPPVTSHSLSDPAVKMTTISEFHFPVHAFKLDIRYKLVYQVFVGGVLVDQMTTVVTYKDNDYFRAQLGLEKIALVDVEMLCDTSISEGGGEGEGESCSLLDTVRDELFTEQFDFIEVGESVREDA